MHAARAGRRTSLPALLCVVGLIGLACGSIRANSATVYQVPSTVAANCSTDVTQPLLSWIASVPNNAVLSFGTGACYRIEGTLEFSGRSGLDFEGNGSTFRSLNAPADQRAVWRVVDSTSISIHNMTIDGSYANGGTYNSGLEHAHAIDSRGSSIDVGGVTMTDVAGDCVYFGRGYTSALTRSSGSVHDSTCLRTGRNGIAVAAGDNILVQHVTLGTIGYDVFDVEPNVGSGWGSNGVTFDSNTINGPFALNIYSVVESGPISNQSFTNNRVVGRGMKVGIADPHGTGNRAQNVTISGNTSDTAQPPAAINVDHVDGLAITGNTVPMAGGPMSALVGVCNASVSGNSYPGGDSEYKFYPEGACTTPPSSNPPTQPPPTQPPPTQPPPTQPPPSPATAISSFSPTSGWVGITVTVTGTGFTGATKASINGTSASFKVVSSTQLTLAVPNGATTGPITIVTPNGKATSAASFTMIRRPRKR